MTDELERSTKAEPEAPAEADASASAPPPVPTNTGDASLLALIDRLGDILERSDLNELEVEVGGTALILRKPAAIPQPVAVAAGADAPPAGSGGIRARGGRGPASPHPARASRLRSPASGTAHRRPALRRSSRWAARSRWVRSSG